MGNIADLLRPLKMIYGQWREKGKSRVSFLADQSAILMSLCSLRMKGKFWSILLLLFYVEGIYLPTLQPQARLWQLNYYLSLWFTQMCLCRFYFPLLLRLANGQSKTTSCFFLVCARTCKTSH